MIPKSFDEISAADLDLLLRDRVAERRSMDYKRDLPGGSDADKREFLADVSSLANANGGDMIFGVVDDNGIPVDIVGINAQTVDADILRLESIVRAGLEPRINLSSRAVVASNAKTVLVMRVAQSWNAPHGVKLNDHFRFHGRTSNGKYALNTDELRQAFIRSADVVQSVSDFRDGRIVEIAAGRMPIRM